MTRRLGLVLSVVSLAVLVVLPLIGVRDYYLQILTEIFMYATLAFAWNILGGITGYPSFGQTAFFGTGAYVTALLITNSGTSFGWAFVLAGLIPGIVAAIIGFPMLRLRGYYFALGTFGVAEAIKQAFHIVKAVGGGTSYTLPIDNGGPIFFYLVMLGLLALSVVVTRLILNGKIGYALKAIREDEDAADSLGINTTFYKMLAFGVSAVICGFVGSTYAYWMSYVDAASAFDAKLNVNMLVMVLVGGAGTLIGPMVGAVLMQLLGVFLMGYLLQSHNLVLGVVVIMVVFLMPKGLVALVIEKVVPRLKLGNTAKESREMT